MLNREKRNAIIDLIHREVVPAVGCTEPAAVALCVARAARLLDAAPDNVEVSLSGNMLKNAMGVGIPGTGMTGLPVAIALGALVGDPAKGLEVLDGVTNDDVSMARRFIDKGKISISLKKPCCDVLYIEATAFADGKKPTKAIISGAHTNFIYAGLAENAPNPDAPAQDTKAASADPKLSLHDVWEFAVDSPLDEIRFILDARKMNKHVAEQSFIYHYGHCVGRTLHCERQRAMMGDSIFSRILSYTSAACDARMAGAPLAVMSNSGSGNQGISATLPVAIYAEETYATEEQTIRALMLSHLTVIYIKQSLGRLSALCGCVVAATGSACGICYLMGGDFDRIAATAKNMVANLTGMICDGAKPGCAMKVASGVSTAIMSALLAMEGHQPSPLEGIIDEDVDKSIANLARIGRDGMASTDALILEIMTSK